MHAQIGSEISQRFTYSYMFDLASTFQSTLLSSQNIAPQCMVELFYTHVVESPYKMLCFLSVKSLRNPVEEF